MKKALTLLSALVACMTICLLCVSCGPSAADEARALIKNGDLAGAVEKASSISNENEKQAVLKEAVIAAMDAQKLTDLATVGANDCATLAKNYSASVKNKMYSAMMSAYTGGDGEATLEVDTNDAAYKSVIEQGKKVSSLYTSYTAVIPTTVQSSLDADTKAADEKYRALCTSLTSFMSDNGLQSYLYSKDVLGSSVGTTKASVTPDTLKTKLSEFKTAYDKIATADTKK